MSQSPQKTLGFAVVVFILMGIAAMSYRWIVTPAVERANEQAAKEDQKKKLVATSSDSQYRDQINFSIDSFSGYAVLRSQEFQNELRRKNIKINLVDDGANYDTRLEALAKGEAQLAVFTIDALIKASAKRGDIPATIVAMIDETKGADAMVAYSKQVPNVDALNSPDTKFVLTPNSPSETLARVVMAHFNFDRLGENPFIECESAEAVYKEYRKSSPDTHQVFVLWEPYVSKVLENPNTHRIIDSSRFRGYIVDVLVVNRDFLFKNPAVVKNFVECYLRASYHHRANMVSLVYDDARKQGTPVTQKQAENLVQGVWWKNTQENFAHFGLYQNQSMQHVEDMILNLTQVLLKTRAISADPTGGSPNQLYYDKILRELHEANFHPGLTPETVRNTDKELAALSDEDWQKLIPVGTLEVRPLSFARGTAELHERSNAILDELIEKLKNFPQYYVLVRGDSTTKGDLVANKELALKRAQAAVEYLLSHGVSKNRVKAEAVEPTGNSAVNFILGELPY